MTTCPYCPREMPHTANRFSTGQLPDEVREFDATPDPDGPEGYAVIVRLAAGEEAADIARNMALSEAQVEGLKPYVHTARNIKVESRTDALPLR